MCALICVCGEDEKKWGGGLLGLQQARSRGLQDYSDRQADLIASLGSVSCYLSVPHSAFRAQTQLWIDPLCDAREACDTQECGKSSHSPTKAPVMATNENY